MTYLLPYSQSSIADSIREIYQGEDPWVAIGCFLNDWWYPGETERESLIAEPLPSTTTPEEKKWAAFCAAVVEELCIRASLASPAWTNQQEYFLAEPWFYDSQPELREWQLTTTPEPFKRRNIFVGGNVLDNKYELKKQFKARPAWMIWSEEELQKYRQHEQ